MSDNSEFEFFYIDRKVADRAMGGEGGILKYLRTQFQQLTAQWTACKTILVDAK
jgi:hypothetical protein